MEHFFDKTSKKCLELAKNMFYKWKEKEIKTTQRRQLNVSGARAAARADDPDASAPSAAAAAAVVVCSCRHERHHGLGWTRPGAVAAVVDGATAAAGFCSLCAPGPAATRKRKAFQIQTPAHERQQRLRNRSVQYRRRPVRRLEFGPAESAFMKPSASPIYYGSPRPFQVRTTSIRSLHASRPVITGQDPAAIPSQLPRDVPHVQNKGLHEKVSQENNGARRNFGGCDKNVRRLVADKREPSGARGPPVAATDSPILVDSVKIVVQRPVTQPAFGSRRHRRHSSDENKPTRRANPCVVECGADIENDVGPAAAAAEKHRCHLNCLSKPSHASNVAVKGRMIVKQPHKSNSGSTASSPVLDTECCENFINEKLELRASRLSGSNAPGDDRGRRLPSEWDDDDAGSAEGAVGGPFISASIRV